MCARSDEGMSRPRSGNSEKAGERHPNSEAVDTRTSPDANQRTSVSEEYLRASTLGELTALSAPILLVDYDPQWPQRFQEEANRIRTVLGEHALRIEHVGSTSIPGLTAKPIISIDIVVANSSNRASDTSALVR